MDTKAIMEGDAEAIGMLVDSVFKEGGLMSSKKLDYKERESQIDGIKTAMISLFREQTLLLEGPCGFGKSFVYLFASMVYSSIANKRVVIATNGITLQEQLYYKDAPLIKGIVENLLSSKIDVVYLKGRNNFLCKRKSTEVEFSLSSGEKIEDIHNKKMLVGWANSSLTGDVSELDYVPDFELWRNFACVDGGDCHKSACAFYDECHYYNLRRKSETSDIIIVNYHLLFSDIKTGRKVLPAYDAIVFDEAHEMAKTARDFQEVRVSYNSFMALSRKISAIENKFGDKFKAKDTNIGNLVSEAYEYFDKLTVTMDIKKSSQMLNEKIDYEELAACLDDFTSEMEIIRDRYETSEDDGYSDVSDNDVRALFFELASAYEQCTDILSGLEDICLQKHPKQFAYHASLDNNNRLISLRAKPIRVGEYFYNNFFISPEGGKPRTPSIITSATLSTGGTFDYIKTEIGLTEANEMIAESPFDLENQELWYLPGDATEGNDYQNFQGRMLENLEELAQACKGGMLGLFTSISNMEAAAWHLRESTRFRVLMQGDMPRQKLIEEFSADKDSILIGTKSLFTGVDVPGDSLRCVFIDKLPFASPDDPVTRELNKESNAFFRYSVPNMCMEFKQAVGRGIRGISDKCVISTADNRLATARYKGSIAKSFPYKKTFTRSIEDVKSFLEKEV